MIIKMLTNGLKKIYNIKLKKNMKKQFNKKTGNKTQKWTIKILNNIRKCTELLNRLLEHGWKLIEDITYNKGYYTFKVEWAN